MTKLNTRDGNDYLITDTEAFKEGIKVIGKELEKGGNTIKDGFKVIGKEVKKKLKEAVWETGRWGNKVFGKELSKKITEAVLETGRVGNTIKKELEKGLKEAKKGFEKIGKELEKQITNSIKKAGCFPGTSTVQTRRGVIEIKNTFNIQNTKLDQIWQIRSATWKWERGIGNGDLDYDDLNSVQ